MHRRLNLLRPILGHIHQGGARFQEPSIEFAFKKELQLLTRAHGELETTLQRASDGAGAGLGVPPVEEQVLHSMWRDRSGSGSRELHYVAHYKEPLVVDVGDVGYVTGMPPRFVWLASLKSELSDGWNAPPIPVPMRHEPRDRWETTIVEGITRHTFRFKDTDMELLADWRKGRPRLQKDFLLRRLNLPDPAHKGLVVDCSKAWKGLEAHAPAIISAHGDGNIRANNLILVVYFKQTSGYASLRLNHPVNSVEDWRTIWAVEGHSLPPEAVYFYESPPGGPTGVWGYFSFSPRPGEPHWRWTPVSDDAGEMWGWTYHSEDWTVEISKPNIKQYIRYVQLVIMPQLTPGDPCAYKPPLYEHLCPTAKSEPDLFERMRRTFASFLWMAAALVPLRPAFSYRLPISLLGHQTQTYTNPILDGNYADPWILEFNDAYYLTPTMPDGAVAVFKSSRLDNFIGANPVTVPVPPNPAAWAPELHRIDGEFYIYCALQDGDEDADRRMHVLHGSDPNDPTAPFTDFGVIGTPDENYAIDGTVLQHTNGKNYFIWSGKKSRELGTVQYLFVKLYLVYCSSRIMFFRYIAEMDTPHSVIGERVEIHSPYWPDGSRKDWQWSPSNTDYGVNEGPEILANGNQTFLTYSACARSWAWFPPDADPLDPASWWAKDDGPVFSPSADTIGTGHASFPRDANGVPYITYHGWDVDAPAGWGSREVRTQAFEFGEDGTPVFPVPAKSGVELPAAAGF
ncbi:Arabinanase/levansucrase/invertase superfamily protein [Mycena kentingensis (nom. inval.)]|nr:Arabinanase/levansucrase/invertase superfamily protein [Mycena kentingensis (nom. inval.)]